MPFATASRPSAGAYLPLFVHAAEEKLNEVQDFIRKQTLFLQLANYKQMYKSTGLGYALVIPHININDAPSTPFVDGDTLSESITTGAGATRHEYAQYASPVSFGWVETRKLSQNEQISMADTRMYNATNAIASDLETDLFYGQSSNLRRIYGLEQFIAPFRQTAATNTAALNRTAAEWRFRQATNVVGGITRSAWTSATTGGTGYENLSADVSNAFSNIVAAGVGFAGAAGGVLNDLCLFFTHFYNLCSQGITRPDFIVSTNRPYEDASAIGNLFIQVQRNDGNKVADTNWGLGDLRFKNADWCYTPAAALSGLNGNNITTGGDCIYLGQSKVMGIRADDEADFDLTEWVYKNSPLGMGCQLVWRGQQIVANPRFTGIVYNYAV